MLMICVMSLPTNLSTFLWVSSKRAVCLEKKCNGLAQFYELFQVLQEFSAKKFYFSESNFLEVYAVAHYNHPVDVLQFWGVNSFSGLLLSCNLPNTSGTKVYTSNVGNSHDLHILNYKLYLPDCNSHSLLLLF